MATWYSNELGTSTANIDSLPAIKPTATAAYGARLKRFRATITLASQASGDIIHLARVPAGATFAFGLYNASATLGGTATLAIGITGTTGKYCAATAFTATAPTLLASPVAVETQSALTAEEVIFATVAGASLPSSGTAVIDLFFSLPN